MSSLFALVNPSAAHLNSVILHGFHALVIYYAFALLLAFAGLPVLLY
jgi:hypothetical protein